MGACYCALSKISVDAWNRENGATRLPVGARLCDGWMYDTEALRREKALRRHFGANWHAALNAVLDVGLHQPGGSSPAVRRVSTQNLQGDAVRAAARPDSSAHADFTSPVDSITTTPRWEDTVAHRTVGDRPSEVFTQQKKQIEEACSRSSDDPMAVFMGNERVFEYLNRMKSQNLRELYTQDRDRSPFPHLAPSDGETYEEQLAREDLATQTIRSYESIFYFGGNMMSGPRRQKWMPVLSSGAIAFTVTLFSIFEGPYIPGPRLLRTQAEGVTVVSDGVFWELSELEASGYPILALLQIVLAVMAICSLWRVVLTNPGALLPLPTPSVETWPSEEVTVTTQNGTVVTLNYCWVCHIYKPPGAGHCRDCGVCCEAMDHHCPYLGTCIGAGNYSKFVTMVALKGSVASSLCTTAHPLYTIFTIRLGTSFFETTMRPDPRSP